MNTSSWARPGALTSACALSLALLAGCADASDVKPSRAASSPADTSEAAEAAEPAARALPEKQLAALALTDGDLPGYRITEPSKRRTRMAARAKDDVKVTRICRPLLEADGLLGDPVSFTVRVATQIPGIAPGDDGRLPDLDGPMRVDVTTIALTSYKGDGARQVMKGLADGLEACEGELSYSLPSRRATTTHVAARKAVAAEGADDSVAFTLSPGKKKGAAPNRLHFQVVRHGSSVITYMTFNTAKSLEGTPYELDAAVVGYQSKKANEWLTRH